MTRLLYSLKICKDHRKTCQRPQLKNMVSKQVALVDKRTVFNQMSKNQNQSNLIDQSEHRFTLSSANENIK